MKTKKPALPPEKKTAAALPPDFEARLKAAKNASLAQLIMRCGRLINEESLREIRRLTGLPLRPSHTSLFPHIALQGTRPIEIARKLGLTRQAIDQILDELEAFGIIERIPDPEDGRGRLIRFSLQEGRTLLDGLAFLQTAETRWLQALRPEEIDLFRGFLLRVLDRLEPTTEPPIDKP